MEGIEYAKISDKPEIHLKIVKLEKEKTKKNSTSLCKFQLEIFKFFCLLVSRYASAFETKEINILKSTILIADKVDKIMVVSNGNNRIDMDDLKLKLKVKNFI